MSVLTEIQLIVVSVKIKEVIAPFLEVRNLRELEKQTGWEEADRLLACNGRSLTR
jgi:hypothetical protein